MTVGTQPPKVTLGLIRDFDLRVGGQHLDVCPTAQRLVGFLAMQAGRPVRRAYVSGVLWMDASDAKASASLRSAIWRSPACDGEQLVLASNTHVWLDPAVQVDVHTAMARARTMLDLPSIDLTAVDIDSELDTFSGDILVGWYDDWVAVERERFRQLRLHVLDQLGELLLRARHYSEAVQAGLVAVSAEPLRESAQRLLVRAHLCEGNLAEALRQYRSYADLLASELGVRPSKAMEGLVSEAFANAATPSWATQARHPMNLTPSVTA
jgi:DNA-binding SARP family transcriptional activator